MILIEYTEKERQGFNVRGTFSCTGMCFIYDKFVSYKNSGDGCYYNIDSLRLKELDIYTAEGCVDDLLLYFMYKKYIV